MHFDLAHALVAGALIYLTIIGLERAGLYIRHKDGGPRFSWVIFGSVFVVMFLLNIIWPFD